MGSTSQYIERMLQKGIDRSVASHLVPEGAWWDMLNWKPSKGELLQTPPIASDTDLVLTTLNGEPDNQVRHLSIVRQAAGTFKYLCLSDRNARLINPTDWTQTELPVILQTSSPSRTTNIGQCLVWGWSTANVPAASGTVTATIVTGATYTVTVVISSGTAAGTYAGLAIAASTAISTTGLYIGFIENDLGVITANEFQVNDAWVWTRTAFPTNAYASTTNYRYDSDVKNRDVYIAGVNRNILRYRDDFITSVGYVRAYGKYVEVFYNHLVIGQYAESSTYVSTETPYRLAWSHLDNPDALFPTSINEADEYAIEGNGYTPCREAGITGVKRLGNKCLIYTSNSISAMSYVGLPNVMQIEKVVSGIGSVFSAGLVVGKYGHYFIGRDNIYSYDGVSVPKPIGDKVASKFLDELVSPTTDEFDSIFGFYDEVNNEVIWTYWASFSGTVYQLRQMVYQELTGEWYFRNLPNVNTDATNITAICPVFDEYSRLLYGASQTLYIDYNAGSVGDTVLHDTLEGTGSDTLVIADGEVYVIEGEDVLAIPSTASANIPTLESPDITYQQAAFEKEINSLFIDASGTNAKFTLQIAPKQYVATAETWQTAETWLPTSFEGRLSLPRVSGRAFRFKLQMSAADTTLPCYNGNIKGWGEFVYGLQKEVEK